MRAIVNGKLYDTEKATERMRGFLPKGGSSLNTYIVYETEKGNIFAKNVDSGKILDAEQIKQLLNGDTKSVDIYIQIFGMPEEA